MSPISTSGTVTLKQQTHPAIVTNGLTLNLDAGNISSYPGTGTTWTDLSGNGHIGTLSGGPIYDSSNLGSIQFDGSNDWCPIPDNNDFNIGTQNTMECWIKPNSTSANRIFFGKINTWWFSRSYGVIGVQLNKFGISFHDGSAYSSLSSTTTASANTWYHLVATWDGTYMRLYVNGSLEATSVDLSSKTWNTTSSALDIGRISGYNNTGLPSNISVARIYHDKALTSIEVLQNYNALKWRYGL